MFAELWRPQELRETVLVTCHPHGDSLGPGSATLGGSARTPLDSTRAFNGASNSDPAGDSSPAATAPPTTKERDSLSYPLTASSTPSSRLPSQHSAEPRPDQTSFLAFLPDLLSPRLSCN